MSPPKLSAATWLILAGAALVALALIGASLAAGVMASVQALVGSREPALAALRAVAALGLLAFLVGLSLYVVVPALSPESAARDHASYRTMLAMLGVAAIPANLVSLVYVAATRPDRAMEPTPGTLIVSIYALELALLGVLYLRIVRPGVLGWREMGLTFTRLGQRVLEGVATALALVFLAAVLGLVLRAFGVQQTQFRLFEGIRDAPAWQYLLLLVGGAVLAPLAEESFFRGYVFTACRRAKGLWQAYLFSAGLFAIAHLNLPALLPILVMGLGFAFVYARTGSLVPTMVAHGLNNAIALTALYYAAHLPE